MSKQYHNGLYLEVRSYAEMFAKLSKPPLLINDFDVSSKEGKRRLNEAMVVSYDGDTLANTPTCGCGKYNEARYLHHTCSVCNIVVDYITDRPLESMLWVQAPKAIGNFFNLTIWRFLRARLRHTGGFSILFWLCDPYYRWDKSARAQATVKQLEDIGLKRGLANFIDNYEEYLTILMQYRLLAPTSSVKAREYTYQYLIDNANKTFFEYLPFPSRLLFVTEKYNETVYMDDSMRNAVDAALAFANIGNSTRQLRQAEVESKVTKAMSIMDDFCNDYERTIMLGKPGVYRKLVFGSKPLFVFRAVITSLHDVHDYDALEFPWSLSVSLFTLHLSNLLLKRDFTPQDIMALISESSLRRHPLIEKLLDELILGGVNPQLVTWLRQPTLERGSFEGNKPISAVKKDPSDNTIGNSDIALRQKNSDFDGDMLSGFLLLCNKWARNYERLSTHLTLMDQNRAFKVSDAADIPKPKLTTLDAWLRDESEDNHKYL